MSLSVWNFSIVCPSDLLSKSTLRDIFSTMLSADKLSWSSTGTFSSTSSKTFSLLGAQTSFWLTGGLSWFSTTSDCTKSLFNISTSIDAAWGSVVEGSNSVFPLNALLMDGGMMSKKDAPHVSNIHLIRILSILKLNPLLPNISV